ncbi:hypothetical protein OC846_003954 [Tilletia horrida]|uniref:GH16 domain-containing protein n=1 Tax=Tilletia horrida TaxID=155126 RepID=A0AAN6GR95_9BASI|nr:hypothetical protein OC845_003967 [Tilletia horrida]KAK0549716.1 hypothetical protein OC846_003954 [Tilletia horrida]
MVAMDQFSHMVLPPSFSPRPAEGIPPYFPFLPPAVPSVKSSWAQWLSPYGSKAASPSGLAANLKPGEVVRSAKAEAAYKLGLELPAPVTAPYASSQSMKSPRTTRKEAKLAAAAASASGSSAAARAYHVFARRAYDKMAVKKTDRHPSSVPSNLGSHLQGRVRRASLVGAKGTVPTSESAPAALAAIAIAHAKEAQALQEAGMAWQDEAVFTSDDDMYTTTPQLRHDGTPIPTDYPSDTDPAMTTPSDEAAPLPSDQMGRQPRSSFRVLRSEPTYMSEKELLSIRLVGAASDGKHEDEKRGRGQKEAENDDDEYSKLLFDWDGMDEDAEEDDDLHDPKRPIKPVFSPSRMIINMGGLILTVLCLLGLLLILPIMTHVLMIWTEEHTTPNITHATVSGIEDLRWTIIDPDTPKSALHRTGGLNGSVPFNLVFSDEFNSDDRSFEPGMDPWWEAVDLWYWGTGDYERYDSRQATTSGGSLRITLEEAPIGGLNFRSGMVQSWNKLCINGPSYIEVAVQLPGFANVSGLWPSVFTLGNLGRAGYGATLEGMWPYTYNTCDVGTLANQTTTDGFPASAAMGGNTIFNRKHDVQAISFLPGQKLSACTCPNDDHPGPALSGDDGHTYFVGRGVPEIDVFEAQVAGTGVGEMAVSQSVQVAPFNYLYAVSNSTGPAFTVQNGQSWKNVYDGEVTQQSISYVTPTLQGAVQHPAPNAASRAPAGAIQARTGYAVYGYELQPGPNGYLQWTSAGQPSWRLNSAAFDADPVSAIDRRVFSEEPMSIIMNLAISSAWSQQRWANLSFPAVMSIDYVRIYAAASMDPAEAITCDPPNMPTYDYIQKHAGAYSNPNLTIWGGTAAEGGYGQNWPRNSLNPDGCYAPLSKNSGSPIDPNPKAPYVPASQIAVT